MRPPYRRKFATARSSTFPQLAKMKLRSFQKKCVCEKKAREAKSPKLLNFWESGTFCDKILMSTDHVETNVHRSVMASLSPSFCTLMKSSNTTIVIPFRKVVVDVLVKLAYTGSCSINDLIIVETLEAAIKYEIDELVQICGDFLVSSLKTSNALNFYDIGKRFCCDHITSDIIKFVSQNFKSFINSGEAVLLTSDQVLTFLTSVYLQMSVADLRQFIQTWADANVDKFTEEDMEMIMNSIHIQRNPGKLVFATGGWSLSPTDIIVTYNHLTDTWLVNNTRLPINSAYHGAVRLNGKLYIAGGFDGERYLDNLYCLDPSTMTWQEMSSMMSKRCYIGTVVLNGKIYALGGHDGTSRLRSVEMYDPSKNMWTEMPDMKQRRSDFGVTVFEGKIFAVGGFDGQDVLSSVEYFCPIEGVWNDSSPLDTPRSGTTAMVLNNKILVLGGYDGTERLQSVECFHPGLTRAVWYQVPDMLNKRTDFAAFVIEGNLVVVGGFPTYGDVEIYCTEENKWTQGIKMNRNRAALECVVLDSSDGYQI